MFEVLTLGWLSILTIVAIYFRCKIGALEASDESLRSTVSDHASKLKVNAECISNLDSACILRTAAAKNGAPEQKKKK